MNKISQKNLTWTFAFILGACGSCFAQQNPAPFSLQTALQTAVDAPPPRASSTTGAAPAPTVSPEYHDSQGRIAVQGDGWGNYGMRYEGTNSVFSELVDQFGNRTRVTKTSDGLPVELKHEFNGQPIWYERFFSDSNGGLLLSSVDQGDSTLATKASQFGIQVGYPDWLKITFKQASTINEVDVVTLQDNPGLNQVPLRASQPGGPTTFTLQGMTDYEVQYLDSTNKWVMIPGGYTTHNRDVAKAFIFSPITTTAIRLVTKENINAIPYPDYTRIVEVEAFEQNTHRNVALASQGATATASSDIPNAPAAAAIDGDETGRLWGNGGGWRDNTPDVKPTPGTVQTTNLGAGLTQATYTNQFAKVVRTINNNPQPTSVPMYQSFMLEKNDISYSGHSFSAGMYMTANGIEYWDNSGGSRIQYYDPQKRLYYVSDWTAGFGTQPVVRVNRDPQGRPTDVYLGRDVALIQFSYDGKGWRSTRLIGREKNTDAVRLMRPDIIGINGPPKSYPPLSRITTGYMPRYGPVIEWHDAVSATPNRICSLKDIPYALLPPGSPTNGSLQPVRWVIYPFADEHEPMTNIRVEYDAQTIYVYLPTLNSGSMSLGPHLLAYRFGRYTGVPVTALNPLGPNSSTTGPSMAAASFPQPKAPTIGRSSGDTPSLSLIFQGRTLQRRILGLLSGRSRGLVESGRERETSGWNSGDGGSGGATDNGTGPDYQDWPYDPPGCDSTGCYPPGREDYLTVVDDPPMLEPPGGFPSNGPPPSDPGNVNQPLPPSDCAQTQGVGKGPTSHTGSIARPRTTPAPTSCPAVSAHPENEIPCNAVELGVNALLQQQLDWAKSIASIAMKDPQCSAFLHDPQNARPPGADSDGHRHPTYFVDWGYTGSEANIFNWGPHYFDTMWNQLSFFDATGSSACPAGKPSCDIATAFVPTDASLVYVCAAEFKTNGEDGAEGGKFMTLVVMHEFLHVLGLGETNDGTGRYPSSEQISGALSEACGDAVLSAIGTSAPPH